MPKTDQEPAAKAAASADPASQNPPPAKPPVKSARPVIHPEPVCKLYLDRPGCEGLMTAERMKNLLGWETEEECAARLIRENSKLTKEAAATNAKRVYDAETLLTLTEAEGAKGVRVVCWHNQGNRPFHETFRRYVQEMLNRRWRFNFENLIVTKTGRVSSAQNRGVALIVAELQRSQGPNAANLQKLWPQPLAVPMSVGYGIEEDEATIATIDNGIPRSEADTYYTSDLFRDGHKGPQGKMVPWTNKERDELTRMLATAVDLLWKRTDAGKLSQLHKYQTHAESKDFLDRHARLKECVRHVFEENQGRRLSLLKLSPGQCAAACYLMAVSDSDGDAYRNPKSGLPKESGLDFDRLAKAKDFFVELAQGSKKMGAVKEVWAKLVDAENPTGGRMIEKLMVMAKAWEAYKGGKPITAELCDLEHKEDGTLDEGEGAGFGGIDLGPRLKDDPEPPSPEELEAQKAAAKAARTAQMAKTAATARAKGEVAKPEPVRHDADGKPPAPQLLKQPLHKATATVPAPTKAKSPTAAKPPQAGKGSAIKAALKK